MSEEKKTMLSEHHNRAHAVLSASASSRWLACTPSVRLSEQIYRLKETTDYAEEGTLAHEIAESCLNAYLSGKEMPDFDQPDEIERKVIRDQLSLYLESIITLYENMKARDPECRIFTEIPVSFDNVAPEGFGTVDCIIVGCRELHVIDLKYGKGIMVDAEDNPQLRLYGIGCLNLFDDPDPVFGSRFDQVITTIIQPRMNHVSNEVITPGDLLSWGIEEVKPRAQLAYEGKGVLVTGDHCRFCPAKAACPLVTSRNLIGKEQMEKYPETELVPIEQYAQLIPVARQLRSWCDSLIEYATDQAKLGEMIPGMKLVEGRGKDSWDSEEQAVKKLKELGFTEEQMYQKKMVSPSHLLKLTSDEDIKARIRKLTVHVPGSPVLADENDRRAAISAELLTEMYGEEPIDKGAG